MDYILKKELFRQFGKGKIVVCLPNDGGHAIACYVGEHSPVLRIRRDTFRKFLELFRDRLEHFCFNGEVYLKLHRDWIPVEIPVKRSCYGK